MVSHDASQCMKALKDDPVKLDYLAEGNAHILYIVSSLRGDADAAAHVGCCLLRMRKERPYTEPAVEAISAFETRIKPLFSPDHLDMLIDQTLFKVDQNLIDEANSFLKGMEIDTPKASERTYVRALERRHIYHLSATIEPYAIMMPNLHHGSISLLEFKPKWLIQSPSAPANARRCRTCALNLSRRAEGRHRGRGDSGFCPLDLHSPDKNVLASALVKVASSSHHDGNSLVDDFVEKAQPALAHLQSLHRKFNGVGLEDFRREGTDFSVAMALRDCSVFLALRRNEDANIGIGQVKFADLDLKSPTGGKLKTWTDTEANLISSGAYTDETVAGGIICALERVQQT